MSTQQPAPVPSRPRPTNFSRRVVPATAWWFFAFALAFELALDGSRLTSPWHALALLVAGGLGGAAGAGLASTRALQRRATNILLAVAPVVVVGLALVTAIVSSRDNLLAPGGCLESTEFATSSIHTTNGVMTMTGANGGQLRFTKTEQASLTLLSAEFWSRGPMPHDEATRVALTRFGCE